MGVLLDGIKAATKIVCLYNVFAAFLLQKGDPGSERQNFIHKSELRFDDPALVVGPESITFREMDLSQRLEESKKELRAVRAEAMKKQTELEMCLTTRMQELADAQWLSKDLSSQISHLQATINGMERTGGNQIDGMVGNAFEGGKEKEKANLKDLQQREQEGLSSYSDDMIVKRELDMATSQQDDAESGSSYILQKKLSQLLDEKDVIAEDRDTLDRQCKELRDSLSVLSVQLKDTSIRERALEMEFEDRHRITKDVLAETSRRLDDVMSANHELTSQLHGVMTVVVGGDIEKIDSEGGEPVETVMGQNDGLTTALSKIVDLESQIQSLKTEMAEVLGREKSFHTKEETYKAELSSIESVRLNLIENVDDLTECLTFEKSRGRGLERRLEELQAKHDRLLVDLENSVNERERLVLQIEELWKEQTKNEKMLADLTGERDALKASDERRTHEINALVKVCAERQKDMELLRSNFSKRLEHALSQNTALESSCRVAIETMRVLVSSKREQGNPPGSGGTAKVSQMPAQQRDYIHRALETVMADLDDARKQNIQALSENVSLDAHEDDSVLKCKLLEHELGNIKRAMAELGGQNAELRKQQSVSQKEDAILRAEIEQLTLEKTSAECDLAIVIGELDVVRQSDDYKKHLILQSGYCALCGRV